MRLQRRKSCRLCAVWYPPSTVKPHHAIDGRQTHPKRQRRGVQVRSSPMVKGDELKIPSRRRAAPFWVLLSGYSLTWKQNALALRPAATDWLTNVFSSAQLSKAPGGADPCGEPEYYQGLCGHFGRSGLHWDPASFTDVASK